MTEVAVEKKPDCYKCKWRREVPGSAHSSCAHPSMQALAADPLGQLLGTLASVGRSAPISGQSMVQDAIRVKANQRGIERGWFNHPWNFDPVWLEECSGFENKESTDE